MHSDVVAEFIRNGGRIVTVQGSIPVTAPEVVEYLSRQGISVGYSPGHSRLYLCRGKLVSLKKLVETANGYRCEQNLPPFVPRTRV